MKKTIRLLLGTLGIATVALMGAGCSGDSFKQMFCKHDYVVTETKEATCYEEGLQERTCRNCGKESLKKIEKTAHTPGETSGFIAPTCTENGKHATTYCAVEECGEIIQEGEEIPALGHEESIIKGFEADCLTDGKTDGVGCVRCGEVLTAQERIPSKGGHKWKQLTSIPATCQEEGYDGGAQCENCGELTGGTIIPLGGHEYENGECNYCGVSEELEKVSEAIDSYYYKSYYLGITSTNYDSNYGESFMGYTFRYVNLGDDVVEEYGSEEAYIEWAYNNGYGAKLPEKLYIVTAKNNTEIHTPVRLNKGRLSLNGKILESNIEYFTDGMYSYVRIPETGLEVEGFTNIVDCRYRNPKRIIYKDKEFLQWSDIEVLHKPLEVVSYKGDLNNSLEKQNDGLYKYTFAGQGDFIMNEAVNLGVGETLVCDFTWGNSMWVEDKGWLGVVFGDGNSLSAYPNEKYGMRCYSEDGTTYVKNGEVIASDKTKTIFDIDGQRDYRITLTKESTGLYSYRLYSLTHSESIDGYVYSVIDEYLNFKCADSTSLMLCVHQDEGNTKSKAFVFEDLVFYKM